MTQSNLRKIGWFGAIAVVCLIFTALPPHASGQAPGPSVVPARISYQILPFEEARKADARIVTHILQTGEGTEEELDKFDNFFARYVLGEWTRAVNRDSLPERRTKLHSYFLMARSPAAHTRLSGVIVGDLSKIATGNFHPVVRVNAALELGELNSEEAHRTADVPVPLSSVLPVLLGIVQDKKNPEAVRAAALTGVRRHAELGIRDAGDRQKTIAVMLKLLESRADAKKDAAAAGPGADWLRGDAADVLGYVGEAGTAGHVSVALTKVIAMSDAEASLYTRQLAARAIGRIPYQNIADMKVGPMLIAAGRFVAATCRNAKKDNGDGVPYPTIIARRVRSVVADASIAMAGTGIDPEHPTGLSSAAKEDPEKTLAAAMVDQLKKLSDALADKNLTADAALQAIEEAGQKIEEAVNKAAPVDKAVPAVDKAAAPAKAAAPPADKNK